MNILFHEKSEGLTFGMVLQGQLFIDQDDGLCMKDDEDGYIVLADKTGEPSGIHCGYTDDYEPIKKIFPKVKKFEFNKD